MCGVVYLYKFIFGVIQNFYSKISYDALSLHVKLMTPPPPPTPADPPHISLAGGQSDCSGNAQLLGARAECSFIDN